MKGIVGTLVAAGLVAGLAWAFGLPVGKAVVAVLGVTLVWLWGRETGRNEKRLREQAVQQAMEEALGYRPRDATDATRN